MEEVWIITILIRTPRTQFKKNVQCVTILLPSGVRMNESVVTIKKALKIKNNLRQIDHRVVVCIGGFINPAQLKKSQKQTAFLPQKRGASKT
jgi:hypothetical protein